MNPSDFFLLSSLEGLISSELSLYFYNVNQTPISCSGHMPFERRMKQLLVGSSRQKRLLGHSPSAYQDARLHCHHYCGIVSVYLGTGPILESS